MVFTFIESINLTLICIFFSLPFYSGGPMFIASPAGGMSIEDVAEATPEKILKQPININGIIIYFIYFSFF